MSELFDIGVVGSGYVGLTTGACLAHIGHRVTCVDIDAQLVAELGEGRIPFYEPGLEELVEGSVLHGRLRFSTDLAPVVRQAEVIFIAVGTPQGNGGIDISSDIRDGLPLDTASIDYAVRIHILPEVPYPDLVPVLRPNGVLRLGLPDLDRTIQAYLRKDSSSFPIPDEEAMSIGAKFVVYLIWYGYTRTFFTHDFVEEQLYKAGSTRVDRCAYGETNSQYSDIVELDNCEEESLCVEAIK
jgi:threonine dehydrogenase-like Zn-dependent dehydrogenase